MLGIGRAARGAGRFAMDHPKLAAMALGPPLITVGAGLGLAGAIGHSMVNPDKEKHTPLLDALFEGVTGDAQLDRHLIGRDIGLSTLYPVNILDRFPSPINKNLWMINPTTFGDIANRTDFTARVASQHVSAGYQQDYDYPQSDMPYRPRTLDMRASGDMVFGMYNRRMR